jgi:hypothetical protein
MNQMDLKYGIELDDSIRSNHSQSGNIRPGVTSNGYLHILFARNGEYVIEFESWLPSDGQVIFNVSRSLIKKRDSIL